MVEKKVKTCEEDEKLRNEAKVLIDSIIISDEKDKEHFKKIFDELENGELKDLFSKLKKIIEDNKNKISKI